MAVPVVPCATCVTLDTRLAQQARLVKRLAALLKAGAGATPRDQLYRYWPEVLPEHRLRFLTDVLTPAECQALLGRVEKDTP